MDAHWHLGGKGRQHFETALKRKRAESAVSQERGAGQNPRQQMQGLKNCGPKGEQTNAKCSYSEA